jgi:succinate dehydrogenase subunit C
MVVSPYPRQHSHTWFVKRWPYRLFMLRELSSVFLAGYVVVLLVLVSDVQDGHHAFTQMQQTLKSPGLLAFNSVALIFALLHSVTWFQAVPKALPVRRGESQVSPVLLVGMHYGLMLVLSAAVFTIALA